MLEARRRVVMLSTVASATSVCCWRAIFFALRALRLREPRLDTGGSSATKSNFREPNFANENPSENELGANAALIARKPNIKCHMSSSCRDETDAASKRRSRRGRRGTKSIALSGTSYVSLTSHAARSSSASGLSRRHFTAASPRVRAQFRAIDWSLATSP